MGESLLEPQITPEHMDDLDSSTRAELEEVFQKISLEEFQEQTGYGLAELSQIQVYETSDGTVHRVTAATMLADDKCPVGKWTRDAFAENSIEGVKELNDDIAKRESGLRIYISEATISRAVKKK